MRPNYVQYTALEGMTWSDWVSSEYNVDGFKLLNGRIFEQNEMFAISSSDNLELSSSLIVENMEYDLY